MEDKEKLWTKDFVLVIIINFLVFLNHLMILSTFPFFIERLGYSDTVSGACATAFSLVAVLARPFVGWLLDTGRRRVLLGTWAVVGVCEYLYLYDGHGYFASFPLFGGYGHVWYGYGVGHCLRTGYR